MDLHLDGRSAVVTGASRGIGLGIARALAREGCRVLLAARGEEALQAAVAGIREDGGEASGLAIDVTTLEAPERLLDEAERQHGAVEVLVSNVGGNRRGQFVDTTDEDWHAVVELNLNSHVRLARRALSGMRDRRAGCLIFVGSIFGREAGGPGLSLYNTTKAALMSLSKILALEMAPHGVRVNTVAPGSIRFPGGSWDRRCLDDPEGMGRFIADELPLGRFGTVEEVADLVAFMASPRASLLTGSCINVDGGQSSSIL